VTTWPNGTAEFSADKRYRYTLSREFSGGSGAAAWIMLNPSTATATEDDPTIRRCIGFSRAWGYRQLYILNLFAFRATDPKELLKTGSPGPVGPYNDEWIRTILSQADMIVCAWGAKAAEVDKGRAADVVTVARATKKPVRCLGTTKDGYPKHPLYLAADTKLVEF
jgi:hypothetical protein